MNSGPAKIYRARILRAVADVSPRDEYRVSDPAALDRICAALVEAEEAKSILRHLGYGNAGDTIVEIAASLGRRKP